MHRLEGTGSTQNTGGSEVNRNKWTQLSPSLTIEQTSRKRWRPPRSVRHLHCHAAIKTINESYLKRHQAEEHRSQWRPAHNHYRAADEMDDLRQLVRAGWMWGGGGRGWRMLLFTPKLDSNWLPVWGEKSGFKTSFSFFSHPSSLASCSQRFSTEGEKKKRTHSKTRRPISSNVLESNVTKIWANSLRHGLKNCSLRCFNWSGCDPTNHRPLSRKGAEPQPGFSCNLSRSGRHFTFKKGVAL